MYGWARLAAAVAVAVTFCASGTPPAFAAADSTTLSRDQIEARRQDLLRLMLQDPSNLDVAFEYASLSSQVGDYEAAVSTLERMLIFAPNTPRLQLELGILYYRLGSYEVSRSYFAQVVANPNVPPEIAAKVRLYLQQLAIEAEPPPFSATIFSGIRWESNANSAPASQAVTLNGIDFTLDTQSVAAPDWSAVNIGTMHYGYDLKNQGDRIEFDAITYNANYFDLTDINSTSPRTFCRTAPLRLSPRTTQARASIPTSRCLKSRPCPISKRTAALRTRAMRSGCRPASTSRPPTTRATAARTRRSALRNKNSFINVALGGVDPETGGLIGARRGGSQLDVSINDNCEGDCAKREALAFTGDIATVSNGSGDHFLGTENPNFVIGFDTTGSHNVGQDIPLDPSSRTAEERSGSTYHVGIGRNGWLQPTQTLSGSYSGYATGMVQSEVPATSFQNVVASTSPDDLTVNFDPVANSLSGSITVRDVTGHDGATEAYVLGFGDNSRDYQNRSAFIDDKHYAAIDSVTGTSVIEGFDDSGAPVHYSNAKASAIW